MSSDPCVTLRRLLEAQRWEEALTHVEELLEANPLAAQLHLLRGQLVQLQDVNTPYLLEDAEKAFQKAIGIDATYFDALVELMHFYDAVCPDTSKAVAYARQVKTLAQKALTEADTILEEELETHA
jgi:tetratricopeptide (TPR) repeat protein